MTIPTDNSDASVPIRSIDVHQNAALTNLKNIARDKSHAIRISMMVSGSLCLMKVVVGVLGGSLAVLAEAANSFLDFVASGFTMFVIRHADEPPDEDHPYGHGKFENIATIVQAMLIMLTGTLILLRAAGSFTSDHVVRHLPLSLGVMTVSCLTSLFIAQYLRRRSKDTHSQALLADSTHFMADVWSNAGVLVALLVVKVTGMQFLDPGIAIVVGLIILKSSWDLLVAAFHDLTDHELLGPSKDALQAILDRHASRILDVHRLRTRRSGAVKIIDMHLTVCRRLSFVAAHDFIDELERDIETELAPANVLIHADPCEADCERRRTCNLASYESKPVKSDG